MLLITPASLRLRINPITTKFDASGSFDRLTTWALPREGLLRLLDDHSLPTRIFLVEALSSESLIAQSSLLYLFVRGGVDIRYTSLAIVSYKP